MPIVPKNLHNKCELNVIQDKGVIEVSLWIDMTTELQ